MYDYSTVRTETVTQYADGYPFFTDCERFLSRFRTFFYISTFLNVSYFFFDVYFVFTSTIHRKANGDSVVREDGGVKYKRPCGGVDAGYR